MMPEPVGTEAAPEEAPPPQQDPASSSVTPAPAVPFPSEVVEKALRLKLHLKQAIGRATGDIKATEHRLVVLHGLKKENGRAQGAFAAGKRVRGEETTDADAEMTGDAEPAAKQQAVDVPGNDQGGTEKEVLESTSAAEGSEPTAMAAESSATDAETSAAQPGMPPQRVKFSVDV